MHKARNLTLYIFKKEYLVNLVKILLVLVLFYCVLLLFTLFLGAF